MEDFERMMGVMLGFGLGIAFMVFLNVTLFVNPQNRIEACQKQHNVYRCEIVAVPVKGE